MRQNFEVVVMWFAKGVDQITLDETLKAARHSIMCCRKDSDFISGFKKVF